MIIVTGASRGLGAAISERLMALGKDIFGIARDVKGLRFPATACDISDADAVKAVAHEIHASGVRVSGLINVAGISLTNLALLTPVEDVRGVVNVNLLGTIYCSQTFSPLMLGAKYGRIINFSSIAVPLAIRGGAVYAASKSGVEAFSRSFAREVSSLGITVNCISPGPIGTDMLRGIPSDEVKEVVNRQVIQKQFEPEDVCDVVELLLDDRARSLSGQVINVGGV